MRCRQSLRHAPFFCGRTPGSHSSARAALSLHAVGRLVCQAPLCRIASLGTPPLSQGELLSVVSQTMLIFRAFVSQTLPPLFEHLPRHIGTADTAPPFAYGHRTACRLVPGDTGWWCWCCPRFPVFLGLLLPPFAPRTQARTFTTWASGSHCSVRAAPSLCAVGRLTCQALLCSVPTHIIPPISRGDS